MNKERFHNALALNMGYKRLVNDKRIAIKIDDTILDPVVTLKLELNHQIFSFNASEDVDGVWMKIQNAQSVLKQESELKEIINAVHQAYIDSNQEIWK